MKAWEQPEVRLAAWGFLLNGAWEVLQSPLFSDFDRGDAYLLWTRLHCTAGDVLILLATFSATSLLLRSRSWPDRGSLPAGLLWTGFGLAYTVWSEIHNTQMVRTWAYAPAMPTIFGIGLTPVLQWLIIPPVLLLILGKNGR